MPFGQRVYTPAPAAHGAPQCAARQIAQAAARIARAAIAVSAPAACGPQQSFVQVFALNERHQPLALTFPLPTKIWQGPQAWPGVPWKKRQPLQVWPALYWGDFD